MATVIIDIDLDKIETEDLIKELKERGETELLYNSFPLLEGFDKINFNKLNILDESKLKYFLSNFDKITEQQLKNIVEQ